MLRSCSERSLGDWRMYELSGTDQRQLAHIGLAIIKTRTIETYNFKESIDYTYSRIMAVRSDVNST